MCIYEYDEEAVKKVWWDEAFAEGYAEGCMLYQYLSERGRMEDIERAISDKAFFNQLLQEMKEQLKAEEDRKDE